MYLNSTMAGGFEVIGDVQNVEPIAIGRAIRDLRRLTKAYGTGRWRKLKGSAFVRLADGSVHAAEVHWYEMTGVGQKEMKIKRLLS